MTAPSNGDSDLTCPRCQNAQMILLESTLLYAVLYCPRCDFAIKEPDWRRQRTRRRRS